MVCRECRDGTITAEPPTTPFEDLIAATPKQVHVAITIGTVEVETTGTVLVDWRYRYKQPGVAG